MEGCRVGQDRAIESLNQQIALLDRRIQLLEKKPSKRFILHQKRRRRAILLQRRDSIEERSQAKTRQALLWK
ncbi:putative uncharacterized protein [Parachlamydia acanthamoebae UV-7]|uniref:Uncharacterized protein n=2 Tax=Parachlamydia acanthamoebae TaxID=83552 RepID=F8L225_PARAV|nr:hypothetical protein [Parachlamydia acanthamoebae]KIA76945.1 hypothetical protein DB43_HC00100 [Parachlamydia acanthamoebae]CCB87345.1 putative uncharacterized protein [Parachlamydia acanthamoebae UV-7]